MIHTKGPFSARLGCRAATLPGLCLFSCVLLICLLLGPSWAGDTTSQYQWRGKRASTKKMSLARRFAPPKGYVRRPLKKGSFARWLRGLPMLPKGSPVRLFNGQRKPSQQHHAGVVALDIGRKDLQQCADAVMRLWGEFMWSRGLQRHVSFNFVSGHRNPWQRWARGDRRRFRRGKIVGWRRRKRRTDRSYRNYRRYLNYVMAWSNTSSLTRQLKRIPAKSARAGDILLVGWRNGSPGHAVLLLDEVVNRRGKRLFLVGQSYMPAQSFHVLKAPGQTTSPWYALPTRGKIQTPEWTFQARQFYRLPHRPSTR